MISGAFAFLLLVLVASSGVQAQTILDCKSTYTQALQAAGAVKASRCTALAAFALCLDTIPTFSDQDRWAAQGYVDSLQFVENCTAFASIPAQPVFAAAGNDFYLNLDHKSDFTISEDGGLQSSSIWSIYDSLQSISSRSADLCTSQNLNGAALSMQSKISGMLTTLSTTFGSLRSSSFESQSSTLTALTSSYKASVSTVYSSPVSRAAVNSGLIDSATSSVTLSSLAKIDSVRQSTISWMNSVNVAAAANQSVMVAQYTSLMASTVQSYSSSIAALKSNNDVLPGATSSAVATVTTSSITSTASKVQSYINTFSNTPYLNRQLPVYRYAVVSTYSQNYGIWFAQNNANMYGGVNPSNWGDGNYYAYQISSNKDLQRGLFTRKGFSGWSGTIWAEEWYYYSSTNSRQVFVMFRIRNTMSTPISWTAYWYFSAFNGWGEPASVSLNGANTYTYTSDCAMCSTSVGMTFPAGRTSTVVFLSASSYPYYTRGVYLGFYSDCLRLPSGLEYVDDFETMTGDYSS